MVQARKQRVSVPGALSAIGGLLQRDIEARRRVTGGHALT